ncbi:hypothetical protein JL722_5382 [Aureococcus anophagefferens]|nr:hypothetical protein JL722_5382 [Aureococcus anophagefferens]
MDLYLACAALVAAWGVRWLLAAPRRALTVAVRQGPALRAANALLWLPCALRDRFGVRVPRVGFMLGRPLSLAALMAAAERRTGLRDWGASASFPALFGLAVDRLNEARPSPVGRLVAFDYLMRRLEVPHVEAIHELGAEEAEECLLALSVEVPLLPPTFRHLVRHCVAGAGADFPDLRAAYALYRTQLELLAAAKDGDADRTWVLKCPAHVPFLGDLLAEFPDARVRRRPKCSLPSLGSMFRTFADMCDAGDVDLGAIGAEQLAFWSRRVAAPRLRREPGGVAHVAYDDLVGDPAAALARVYGDLGLDAPPDLAEAVAADLAQRSPAPAAAAAARALPSPSTASPLRAAILVFAAAARLARVSGHAMMTIPPARQIVHDVAIDPKVQEGGYSKILRNPSTKDLVSLNHGIGGGVGGKTKQAEKGFGLCGDDGGRAMYSGIFDAASDKYGQTAPQVEWVAGSTVDLQALVTAHHLGWFEFRLCPMDAMGEVLTQECLNEHCPALAEFDARGFNGAGVPWGTCCTDYAPADKGGGACSDPEHNDDRWMVPDGSTDTYYDMRYVLPAGVTCEHCVLQWTYVTGNSVDNFPEVFRNCADVRIVDGGGSRAPSPRPTAPAPTPAAAKETPAPTTTPGRDGRCCWWDNYDPAGDPQCFNCQSDQERSCASSRSKCEADCGGHYCAFDEAWTAAPTPTPPVNDGGEGCECRSASEVTSDAWCWKTECAKSASAPASAPTRADGVVCSGGSGGGPARPAAAAAGPRPATRTRSARRARPDRSASSRTRGASPSRAPRSTSRRGTACSSAPEAPPANTLAPTPATTTTKPPKACEDRSTEKSSTRARLQVEGRPGQVRRRRRRDDDDGGPDDGRAARDDDGGRDDDGRASAVPPAITWNGEAIYDSMSAAGVLEVMKGVEPAWKNEYNWMKVKINALIDYCKTNNKRFLWAFGGWSDLTKTIGGDQQRLIVGKVIAALKPALVAAGMGDKIISYTPRYNAFFPKAGSKYGQNNFATDGEGTDIFNYLKANSDYGVDAVDYVHLMMYDLDATDAFVGATEQYFVAAHYDAVVKSHHDYGIPLDKVVMGFEPGPQAYTGVWGGMDHDMATIARMREMGLGGVMFWAVNDPKVASNGKTVGENSIALANYAARSSW